ncbi:mechanosensitive ion channel domain-containing protein [Altericroceibacterium endophyticum]|uniref:Mechanosensitive ion channel n=1 Tax=Altericroceibacterium endophyticum TaxID=1808508 RepID=A0A6I4T652_9SPHN|nr:mechanosensitive ion channel [Altericroceibacterium endophyticum]
MVDELMPMVEPSASPSAAASAIPTSVPTPEASGQEAVQAADSIKNAISQHSLTIGDLINKLDAIGFTVGTTRVSVWGALLVLLVIAAVIVFARIGSMAAHSMFKRFTRLGAAQQLLGEKLLTLVVWAVAILIGIDVLGINLTALTVFSGAFGLAIGFGLQKTFGNLIAGIILLMDRSIKPGDVIAVSDQAGNSTFGQIRKIGIRAVSVTTRDRREYLIPNEQLMINQVENWSYSSKTVRIQVPVGVSYQCDIKLAEELMLEAAKSAKRVLDSPPPTVWLDGYGNSSVDFVIQCWISDPEEGVGNVRSEVLKNLWWQFQEKGIEIPFPQRDVNLRGNEQFEQLIAAISQRMDDRGKPDKASE